MKVRMRRNNAPPASDHPVILSFYVKTGRVLTYGDSIYHRGLKLYQKASTNQLQMLLLGDTKIRSDAELLMNFGLVSNTNTQQEAKDIKLVEELMAKRAAIARKRARS